MENKRTIETILSLETGEQHEASELLRDPENREGEIFQLRTKIEIKIRTHSADLVCWFCKQPVAIRGRRNEHDNSKHFFFTHLKESKECIIKTDHKFSEEQIRCIKYNGEKESVLHLKLKTQIAYYLEQDNLIKEVLVEKVFKDKAISEQWRKPDVMAIYEDKKIAFELQLSTTFLTVIVGRTIFYAERGIFLIWIFPNFSLESDLQKFTQKDVFYNNNYNVYVFDKEAQEKSKQKNQLILKCWYQEFRIENEIIRDRWQIAFIKIEELNFDFEKTVFWFYNSELEKIKLNNELENIKKQKQEALKLQRLNYKIDGAVKFLRTYYTEDKAPIFYDEKSPIDKILTESEILALNNTLEFEKKNSQLIAKLFIERKKRNFLKYICEQSVIKINLKTLNNGKTVFEEITDFVEERDFNFYIALLFRKGYELTERDLQIFDGLYDNYHLNQSEVEKENIKRWALISFYRNLKRLDELNKIKENIELFYAIQSLKTGLIIGSDFNNLRQISNNIIEYYGEFGNIYIKSMKFFNQYEIQLKEDKHGKLKAKIDNFELNNPIQNRICDNIIYEIFYMK